MSALYKFFYILKGPDLMDIFVTSGSTKNEDGSIKGGQLFVIKDTGAKGIPARCFDPTKKWYFFLPKLLIINLW